MSRRSTPERLHQARRAGIIARVIVEGELPDAAERLVASWEVRADRDGLERDGRYWETGWAWITARRNGPPSPSV